jgi:hypothetical protein
MVAGYFRNTAQQQRQAARAMKMQEWIILKIIDGRYDGAVARRWTA